MKKQDNPTIAYLKVVEQVDWSLFCLSQIAEQEANKKPRTPVEVMVDNATGYKVDKDRETIEVVLYHLRRIVRYKKKLNKEFECEHSTEDTENNIAQLKAILQSMPASKTNKTIS